MKTVVITGSSRGLGLEMARRFCMAGFNVVINGISEKRLEEAKAKLIAISGDSKVEAFKGDVKSPEDLKGLMDFAVSKFGTIDIWINNAGVNQPMKAIWELTEEEINVLIDIDLKGAMLGSRIAVLQMEKQPEGGFIYNVEGHGSNDAYITGLSVYGTGKRAVTYFTRALAKEIDDRQSKVKAGLLSPGIMLTDFTVQALGGKEAIDLPEKTKKVYNILGDNPDVVAEFLVNGMLKNRKNNAKIEWLTGRKAAWRFMTAPFCRKEHFK